jgi:hypothetical protein
MKVPIKFPRIRLPSVKIAATSIQELAMLAGFLMLLRGLWMWWPPLMWMLGGLWLMLPGKEVR